ncbi:hypothetical protein [Roseobacter sp. HKCCA0434]|uniref:hypothetical protein n=1 Tax=Roseobacter sp. HKCCA0434 TaxID=3079297 RepID=UPI002905BF7B|nr:hypothetical protein [Roseobacter sp. HKCCA0434]
MPGMLKGRIARRARRGLSMVEATLVMGIILLAVQQGINLWQAEIARQQNRSELWTLSRLADAAQSYFEADLVDRIAEVRATATSVRQITEVELEGAGVLDPGVTMFSPTGRPIDLWAYSPSADEVILLARATGNLDVENIPAGADGLGAIGWVSPLDDDALSGPGVEMDIAYLQGAEGLPVAGDTVAIRYLNLRADLRPYVYRRSLGPGFEELNRMETTLDMNGYEITGVSTFRTDRLEVTTLFADSMSVAGTLTSDLMAVTGDLDVGGDITATSATFEELDIDGEMVASAIEAGSATISGEVTATTLDVTDALTGGTGTFDDVIADTVVAQDLESRRGVLRSVSADEGVFTNSLYSTFGTFRNIITGVCTGC